MFIVFILKVILGFEMAKSSYLKYNISTASKSFFVQVLQFVPFDSIWITNEHV